MVRCRHVLFIISLALWHIVIDLFSAVMQHVKADAGQERTAERTSDKAERILVGPLRVIVFLVHVQCEFLPDDFGKGYGWVCDAT